MRWQQRFQLLRRRRRLRDHGIQFPPQHLLRQLGDALVDVHNAPILPQRFAAWSAVPARHVNIETQYRRVRST
jgi:hypothetical protein